ncbi:hypothetical protein V6B08_20105 [Ferrovibrio sp. MS7]|uniref:hypothetical protein n=1 Tax=Ferrovibrio plantarum TaxID=3119164 RepID=UPI00313647E2
MARLLIAGASGLVGKIALWAALDDARVEQVVGIGRRPLPIQHPKLEQRISDFTTPLPDLGHFDGALCALGTTIAKAGSQAAFRAIDQDAVLTFARAAQAAGVQRFALVSAAGANAAAKNFYLSVKGAVERDLETMGFPILVRLRPGLIIGDRAERRPAEWLFQKINPLINPLLTGSLRRYRSIPATTIAHALLNAGLAATQSAVLEFDGIRAMAGSADT